jgi:trigger factor
VKASLEKQEKNEVKVKVEVDGAAFERALQAAYLKNRGRIAIQGFRKGKAPRAVIEAHYGKGVFYEDAINDLYAETYPQAVEDTGIEPVDRPAVEIDEIDEEKGVTYTATVTVKPEVKLGKYKGIEIEEIEYNVTDQEVDEAIEQVRERNARWIAVNERPVREGDRVLLDYSGSIDGVQFDGGTAERQTLDIGSHTFIPGFEEQIVGMAAGDKKDIHVTFPEEYHEESLKGKEAVFAVTIHEIKEKELPELDDEFAKDVSEWDTLDEYKADMRLKMEKDAGERAQAQRENQLIEKVAANAEVDIPPVMVDNQIDDMLREMEMQYRYYGMTLEKYLEMSGTSMEDYRSRFSDEAYNRVKARLVLEVASKAEDPEVTEEDIQAEYQRIADQYKRPVEEVEERYAANREAFIEGLKVQKTIDLLLREAKMVAPKKTAKKTEKKTTGAASKEKKENRDNAE